MLAATLLFAAVAWLCTPAVSAPIYPSQIMQDAAAPSVETVQYRRGWRGGYRPGYYGGRYYWRGYGYVPFYGYAPYYYGYAPYYSAPYAPYYSGPYYGAPYYAYPINPINPPSTY